MMTKQLALKNADVHFWWLCSFCIARKQHSEVILSVNLGFMKWEQLAHEKSHNFENSGGIKTTERIRLFTNNHITSQILHLCPSPKVLALNSIWHCYSRRFYQDQLH